MVLVWITEKSFPRVVAILDRASFYDHIKISFRPSRVARVSPRGVQEVAAGGSPLQSQPELQSEILFHNSKLLGIELMSERLSACAKPRFDPCPWKDAFCPTEMPWALALLPRETWNLSVQVFSECRVLGQKVLGISLTYKWNWNFWKHSWTKEPSCSIRNFWFTIIYFIWSTN